jgi:outer membrane protein assembly factor BamB
VLKNLNNHAASPVFGKTLLYIGFLTDAFYAIEPESSEVQWKIPVKAGIVTVGVASTAVVADGMVYFAGMDGVLYVVKDE